MTFDPTQNRVMKGLLTADEALVLDAAIKANGGEFWNHPRGVWEDKMTTDCYLYPGATYRAKPAPAPTLSITVNGVTNVVAAPVTEKPALGTKYYVAAPLNDKWFTWNPWGDDADDNFYLSRRVIHLTEAAARAHAMAMVGLKAEGVL